MNDTIKEEQKILAEEKEILSEIKQEEKKAAATLRHIWVATLSVSVLAAVALVIGAYAYGLHKTVYIEKASIDAPHIDIAPENSGILNDVYVHAGDSIPANTAVAKVGNELIKTKEAGMVISASNQIGKLFNHGEAVVTVIDPRDLRALGSIQEDNGLADIRIGALARFTVDAFGSREFAGVVDEVSPVSDQSDVVFSISDKREKKNFTIKVRYDTDAYTELKPGMSAKIWINK